MAKQSGVLRLLGTIGNITFLKTQDGFLAKEKTSLNGEQISKGKNFQRTRENNAEFSNAGKAGKLLRQAAHNLMTVAKDSKVTSRVVKVMIQALKLDTVDPRGERTVANGDVSVFAGFEFNINSTLTSVLLPQYTGTIDRDGGTMTANIPAFTPLNDIVAPEGTTHFIIVSAGIEIDFANSVSVTGLSNSGILPYDNSGLKPLTLTDTVTPKSTNKLFLLLGVQFYQQVNGVNYSLRNGAFNPLSVISVSNS